MWVLNHYVIGTDGKPPMSRLTTGTYSYKLVDFGENVQAKPIRNAAKADKVQGQLEERWVDGVWVGISHRTGENLVAIGNGSVVRVRSIRRQDPARSRWSAGKVLGIRATPRAPNPDKLDQEAPAPPPRTTDGEHRTMEGGEDGEGGESIPPPPAAPAEVLQENRRHAVEVRVQ